MSGLRRICKQFGRLKVSNNGTSITWLWDYANDEPVKAEDMPFGSPRHAAPERARCAQLRAAIEQEQQQ